MNLLDDIQTAVYDELVHVPGLLAEARLAIAALLRRPELVLEERVVLRADYGEVVRHPWRLLICRTSATKFTGKGNEAREFWIASYMQIGCRYVFCRLHVVAERQHLSWT